MNWSEMQLRRLFGAQIAGTWGSEPEDGDVVASCVRGTDFDYSRLRVGLDRCPQRGMSRADFKKRRLLPGDIVLEKSGGGETQPVGRAVLFTETVDAVPTNFAALLRPLPSVSPQFVSYLLASLWATGATRATINQTTGIQNLDSDLFFSIRVRVPDRHVQQAIADYLDAETARIDALIDKKRRMIELLEERWQAWLEAFFLRPSWPVTRLKHLLRAAPCYGVLVPRFADQGVPFVRVNDLPFLDDADRDLPRIESAQSAEYTRTQLAPGDVLVSVVGSVDKVAIVPGWLAGANCARAVCRLLPRTGVPSRLLASWLRTMHYNHLARLFTGSDTAQPTLNMGDVANFNLRFPTEAEADEATIRVTEAERPYRALKTELSAQVERFVEHRQALVTAAVTGELAIPGVAA